MTVETFAVAIVGETNAGWLIEARSADEAVELVHESVPRARKVWRGELLVWNESYYRSRYLAGAPFPASWTRV